MSLSKKTARDVVVGTRPGLLSRLGFNAALAATFSAAAFAFGPADASSAPAQPQQGDGAGARPATRQAGGAGAQPAGKPFLNFYYGGTDSFLKSPKDKWILDALHRIEAGEIQLPPDPLAEFNRDPNARIVAKLIRDLVTTRYAGSFAAVAGGNGPPMPQGQITMFGNARRPGGTLEPVIIDALKSGRLWSAFQPDPDHAGLRTFKPGEDAPTIWFGSMDVGGTSATVASVGIPPSAQAISFERFGAAQGVDPQFAFELDFAPLQPLLAFAANMMPEGPDGKSPLEQMGLISKTPMVFRAIGTNDGNECRIEARLVNGVKATNVPDAARALVLTKADLQWVPADARWAAVSKVDMAYTLNSVLDQMNAQAQFLDEEGDFEGDDMNGDGDGMNGSDDGKGADDAKSPNEGIAERWVHEHLGLDLRRDLIAPLGDTMAWSSPTNLGGGFYGANAVIGLKDAATMKKTLARLATVLSEQHEVTKIGLGLHERSAPGCDAFYSLTCAGLPIPIQLSIGIGNGALVFGLSPQAVTTAIAQSKGKTSILDNPSFKLMNGADMVKGANSLQWFDTPATLREGYGFLLALADTADSALLPQSGAPAPLSTTVPTLEELVKGAKPAILVGRISGDDFTWTYRHDASASVQIAGVVAYVATISPMTTAMAVGILLPALEKAREAARDAQMRAREAAIRRQTDAGDPTRTPTMSQADEAGAELRLEPRLVAADGAESSSGR